MARDRFLISLALALAIHALALFVVELIIRNQRARLPEYSGPLFVLLEEVPVIARSLPAAPEAAEQPPPAASARPAPSAAAASPDAARPRAAAVPPPGGDAPGVRAAEVVKPAPRETVTAPTVPEAAPPPARRSEPFVPEEVVIPSAGRGEAAETPGAAGDEAAPSSGGQAPAAARELTELDSALRERREADAAASTAPAGESASGSPESAALETGAEAAGDGFDIQWDDPSQGREATSRPLPDLPAWVSKQGLSLRVTVSFVLTPQGFLDEVKTVDSSGYSDVDAAVLEALRLWRFKPVASTRSVRGSVSYRIEPR